MDKDLIRAMYGNKDDGETAETPMLNASNNEIAPINNRVCTIKIEGKAVTLPTIEYVQALERTIEEQDRTIRRLEQRIGNLINTTRSLSRDVNAIQRDAWDTWDRP